MGVMLREYANANVKINNYDNELLAVGIINELDDDKIEIKPVDRCTLPILSFGLPVKISLQQKNHQVVELGAVVYLSSNDFLVVSDVKLMEEIKQRKYFRVSTGTEGFLSRITSPINREMLRLYQEIQRPDEGDSQKVWVVDVSLMGAKFISSNWLELGKEYLLRFTLSDTQLALCARIIHIAAFIDKPIEYSCSFFDLQEKEEVMLCRCLYRMQMIKRRRKINMVDHHSSVGRQRR